MDPVQQGHLLPPTAAPATGELVRTLAQTADFLVEEILSGRLVDPVDFRADHSEWVVVLEGAAELEVDGEEVHLGAGGWVLLPAGVPHRLVSTSAGTRWLAIHAAADEDPPSPRS